ncbi:TetR/AcrR family transcriptional regulator [Prevotella histicola]|jgi:putative transcription regulator, tetR family|uniref:TetR/AcrR family transcriptional regulator n=1 Tax=Prevotella histicola TaxID=470565 RepID=UPI001C5DFB0E|nr:TetR/AcrR family transcriptional regulator [Prevotella histicola]MBF1400761.1 TetR/AcrR family transcriptional regulator [Prevotella histicola]MBW4711574.1 TetR/AcrR family transcriptional regulator [Prevotella histicola]MBW4876532.1 TetR/AcrR family transcriptional regulator [Prevotella histicola]MBW4920358.1 TetR/AcrR family transcriptional regulator [Prevotella histicola]
MKNREQTECKILEAVASIVESEGFEKLGINTIASKANVSKMLIYRYFGGLDELIAQFIMQKDYWANTDTVIINPKSVGDSIKSMFRKQIEQLRSDVTLRRLCRWELSCNNTSIEQLRAKREENGCSLIKMVSTLTSCPNTEIAALASILSASISYLALIEDQCLTYNGISLQTDKGWDQIMQGVEMIIDLWIKSIQE